MIFHGTEIGNNILIVVDALNKNQYIVFANHLTMWTYVDKDWIEALWMWVRIQRVVAQFLADTVYIRQQWEAYRRGPLNNLEPSMPKLPKVRNSAVFPLSNAKMKHISFDHTDLIHLIGLRELRERNTITARHDFRTYYKVDGHKDEAWDLLFSMDEIRKLRTGSE